MEPFVIQLVKLMVAAVMTRRETLMSKSWNEIFSVTLIIAQLVTTLPAFYGTRRT